MSEQPQISRPESYPLNESMAAQPEAVTVDIIEARPPRSPGERRGQDGLCIPTHILINGRPVYTPRGAKVTVSVSGEEAATVSITFFARRVRIGHADELLLG